MPEGTQAEPSSVLIYRDADGEHALDLDGPNIVKLHHPLEPGDVTELRFRELEAGDMWDVPSSDRITVGHAFEVAARMTEQPPSLIRKLRGRDIGTVQTIVEAFLTASRGDG